MTEQTESGALRIERALRQAEAAGHPALAPFLTAGFPSRAAFADLLRKVAAEADLVEIGVPFTDPMADGVTIQHSSRVALEDGVNLGWILDMLRDTPTGAPRVLMSYLNPLLAFDLAALAGAAGSAGVSGLIVPDLPFEECETVRDLLDAHGVALVQLVTPVTPADRLRRLALASRGFVYAVAMTGPTGGTAEHDEETLRYLDRVRDASPLPVLVGFGVRRPDQLRAVGQHAAGAIVGSALIEVIERGDDPAMFLRGLR